MSSPENISNIQVEREHESAKITDKWLSRLVQEKYASTPQEALKKMGNLAESVLSPESVINTLIDTKVNEIIQSNIDLSDKGVRDESIKEKLKEIFEERKDFFEEIHRSNPEDIERSIIQDGEKALIYELFERLILARSKKEPDPLRKRFLEIVSGAHIARYRDEKIFPLFFQGEPQMIEKKEYLTEDTLKDFSPEYQRLAPSVKESLEHLTPETLLETIKSLRDGIQEAELSFEKNTLVYFKTVEQKDVYGNPQRTRAEREANHIAITSGILFKGYGIPNGLNNFYHILDRLELLSRIESAIKSNAALYADELIDDSEKYEDIFDFSYRFMRAYKGRQFDEVRRELWQKLKNFVF